MKVLILIWGMMMEKLSSWTWFVDKKTLQKCWERRLRLWQKHMVLTLYWRTTKIKICFTILLKPFQETMDHLLFIQSTSWQLQSTLFLKDVMFLIWTQMETFLWFLPLTMILKSRVQQEALHLFITSWIKW